MSYFEPYFVQMPYVFLEKTYLDTISSLCAVATPILAIVISYYFYTKSNYNLEIEKINNEIFNIINISIQYPIVEDDGFCKRWDGSYLDNEVKTRYYLYCCLVFNVIEKIYNIKEGNISKMEKILFFEEYIISHRKWWEHEINKTGGYSKEFIQFVNRILSEE